jgi:hypothetical protein
VQAQGRPDDLVVDRHHGPLPRTHRTRETHGQFLFVVIVLRRFAVHPRFRDVEPHGVEHHGVGLVGDGAKGRVARPRQGARGEIQTQIEPDVFRVERAIGGVMALRSLERETAVKRRSGVTAKPGVLPSSLVS